MTSVYVIQAEGGPVKIGVATNPSQRLIALKTGTPFRLALAHVMPIKDVSAFAVEKAAHRMLAEDRLHGEWFDVQAKDAIDAVHAAYAALLARPSIDPAARLAIWADADCEKRWGGLLTGEMLRAGQAALKLSHQKTAVLSGVSASVIRRFAQCRGTVQGLVSNAWKVAAALERQGLVFVEEHNGQPGVRLRKQLAASPTE